MFKLEKKPSITWPVTVQIPRDGGKTTKATFEAEFRLLDQDEFDRVYSEGGTDRDLLARVLVGWSGVQDDAGGEMTFSDEARATLAAIPYVRQALVTAYLQCATGREAARKN